MIKQAPNEMDKIFIESLQLKTIIGVHEWEQKLPQTLIIDLILYRNFEKIDDVVEQTIDYDALTKFVEEFITNRTFKLIETVANQVADQLLAKFPIDRITVKVSKPHALRSAKNVKVEVNRPSAYDELTS